MTVLEVKNLHTHFHTSQGIARAVDGVSFTLKRGETVALVGESGCGKTVLATSVLRLFRKPNVFHPSGSILYNNADLLMRTPAEMEAIRGRHLAMIFQEPMAALNPVQKIGQQISEAQIRHLGRSTDQAWRRSVELLELLGVPSPERIAATYPHTLSGGMRQRVAIAMALSCKPDILVADEPTTALDVTVQAQILHLLKDLQKEMGMAILLITHDLGVVNEIADRTLVMYSGRLIETGPTADVLFTPKHPYTQKLLAAVPSMDKLVHRLAAIKGQVRPATDFVEGCRFADRCDHAAGTCLSATPPKLLTKNQQQVACYLYDEKSQVLPQTPALSTSDEQSNLIPQTGDPILRLENVQTWFPVHSGIFKKRTGYVKAVDDISFELKQGETLALVGESGCGKSTLGQTILRLVNATSGRILWLGSQTPDAQEILSADRSTLLSLRREMQMIFQDPFASLNPRFSVREIIDEGLRIHEPALSSDARDQRIGDILEEVGLPRASQFRYPHEFSGGQRQRVAIARALVLKPKLLILDEATSALDVSIQAQVLNLLHDIQKRYNITFIFITHNLESYAILPIASQ